MAQQIILQIVLIALNAFFAATEIAVISLNEKKLKSMADDGDKKAGKMLKIIEDPTKFLSTIQVGITLAGFLGSAFAADNFAERLTGFIVSTFGVAEAYIGTIDTISVILITLILSYFTLVLGELVPKRVAMKHKEKLATAVCGIISVLTVILKPIIWFLTVSTNIVLRLFGINPHEKEDKVSEEDIVIMLDAGVDDGTLDGEDIGIIKNVFKLDNLCAADVMTQRNAVVAVSENATDDEILAVIEGEGYSRVPVYSESIDNIVGVLHTRDYLIKHGKADFRLGDAMITASFVPENMHLDALFKEMQEEHKHIVIVVNEYGHVSGIVTMEDIIEELVGEIWDEQDDATELITKIDDVNYKVVPCVSIDEFFTCFKLDHDEEIESTTVNGWLTEQLGGIPKAGDSFEYANLSISVTLADEVMAQEVLVTVREKISRTDDKKAENDNNE